MVTYSERADEPGGREPAPGRLRVVQQFVNSVNIESGVDLFDRPDVVGQWFIDKGLAAQSITLTKADASQVTTFREALRGLLEANHRGCVPDLADVEILNTAARAAQLGVTIAESNGVALTSHGSGLHSALGELLAITIEASLSRQWQRLKACTNQGCRWAYWDGSRNRSSRWCSMALCGNQAKVRTHRERRDLPS